MSVIGYCMLLQYRMQCFDTWVGMLPLTRCLNAARRLGAAVHCGPAHLHGRTRSGGAAARGRPRDTRRAAGPGLHPHAQLYAQQPAPLPAAVHPLLRGAAPPGRRLRPQPSPLPAAPQQYAQRAVLLRAAAFVAGAAAAASAAATAATTAANFPGRLGICKRCRRAVRAAVLCVWGAGRAAVLYCPASPPGAAATPNGGAWHGPSAGVLATTGARGLLVADAADAAARLAAI